MITHETQVRVRYADTDQMGYVYHAKYLEYLEVGRTEMIRHLGLPYAEVEKQGIMMPVADVAIKFRAPAHYDEVLTVKTTVAALPKASFPFRYEIVNEKGKTVLQADLRLAFIDMQRNKPVRVPDFILQAVKNALTLGKIA
jgi:acyl-CoA thioester hydrolase